MPRTSLNRHASAAVLASLLHSIPGIVQAQSACPPPTPLIAPPTHPIATTDDLRVRADRATVEEETGVAVFSGNVEAEYQGRILYADEVRYHRQTDVIEARGNVRLLNEAGDAIVTPFLRLERATGSGSTDELRFALGKEEVGHGTAERSTLRENRFVTLEKGRFTTCPVGSEDWVVIAPDIELDKAKDLGVARNARVEFKGVPIFYWPYFDFPISGARKSGFLIPSVGNSLNSGFSASVPYYWNIAPNMDDTVTPRLLAKRGLQVQNEFRYLGRTNQGLANLEYLPSDKLYGNDRSAGTLRYEQRLQDWRAFADVRAVSDKDYLSDFGDNLAIASQTHLPQLLELSYEGSPYWRTAGRLQTYQTIDRTLTPDQRPYFRLPQLLFSGALPNGGTGEPRYALDGELVNFQHDVKLTGTRLTLFPNVSLPWRNAYAYSVPKLGVQQISYSLRETDQSSPTLSIPVFSIDNGLIFERELQWRNRELIQTLEPRLFYVYIPYRNQDTLPIFDTGRTDLVYANLFRENRFSGGDRVGDTSQVTFGLTSRLLNENAEEQARVSVGQIYYFNEHRVNLEPGVTTEPDYSPIAGEAQAFLAQRWLGRASFQWDPHERRAEQSDFYLQYRPGRGRVLSVGYRLIRDVQERVEVSTQWPLAARWAVLAVDSYSLLEHKDLESYLGLQYRSCCWAVRVYAHSRVGQNDDTARSFIFEFELTGLATLGEPPLRPLQQDAFLFEK